MIASLEQISPPLEAVPVAQPLSPDEKSRLKVLELTVEHNLAGFIKCGRALLEIRESRLYRERYATFADYCRERFAIARSTADQLCRSTQVYETLNACLAGSDTPVPATVPEIVLRSLTTLPGSELQAQTWRLAASVSPDKKPTRTIAARVARMVKDVISGDAKKNGHAKDAEPMFVRPIRRLARINTFRPDLAVLHVDSPVQATKIIADCRIVASRCCAIEKHLNEKFA